MKLQIVIGGVARASFSEMGDIAPSMLSCNSLQVMLFVLLNALQYPQCNTQCSTVQWASLIAQCAVQFSAMINAIVCELQLCAMISAMVCAVGRHQLLQENLLCLSSSPPPPAA